MDNLSGQPTLAFSQVLGIVDSTYRAKHRKQPEANEAADRESVIIHPGQGKTWCRQGGKQRHSERPERIGCNGVSCTDGLARVPLSTFGANIRLNPFRMAADKNGRRASVFRLPECGGGRNIAALHLSPLKRSFHR